MGHSVTIGGDRVGSGKKNKVHLHGYERSTHDLGYIWRSSMAAGTIVPFLTELGLNGDTFDIDLDCDVKTHPTVGPLFGSFKVQLDVFQTPIRLYQGQLHNNKLGIGMNMAEVKLPVMRIDAPGLYGDGSTDYALADLDNTQINPSSIFAYLGIRGIGKRGSVGDTFRRFNAIPFLIYWDIYKNYYANKQEEKGAVLHNIGSALVQSVTQINVYSAAGSDLGQIGTSANSVARRIGLTDRLRIPHTAGQPPKIEQVMLATQYGWRTLDTLFASVRYESNTMMWVEGNITGAVIIANRWQYINPTIVNNGAPIVQVFDLENIDNMRENILVNTRSSGAYEINQASDAPYGLPFIKQGVSWSKMGSQEGLGLKTYQSDLFNNWISTEWLDGDNGVNAVTAIDTSTGEFTIDTLNLAKKVYDMLNRIAISGGSYDDWQDAVYDHQRYRRAESPVYQGGLSKELVFQEVFSTAESGGEDLYQPLGTLAGKGVMANKHKGGKVVVKVDEPIYITGYVSLTPRIDYSQGNSWLGQIFTMDDLHKPALDEIGFQDLIIDQMAWWDTDISDSGEVTMHSAGKQPAWMNYMTNVNKALGNFAIMQNEMFMTLNRRYEAGATSYGVGVKDMTTYIDPMKFNYIFAETSRDAQNFWVQIKVDITARRKMSAKVMPNL